MSKCIICGKPYSKKETIRKFGDAYWVGYCCSPQCYTMWTSGEYGIKEEE